MNETSKNRREWVKTAAIIFLSVMLVLTFFSNTIMNYSLPEVATQYVQSGTITAKIRGNGTVESSDPYNVTTQQTRKVMSVAVKAGDQVQKGDVLVYLEDTESEELKAALEALETAQEAYEVALLAEDVSAGVVSNAHGNVSTNTYRQQIEAAQAAVKEAQAAVDDWQAKYDDATVKLTLTPSNQADISAETKAVNDAQAAVNSAQAAVSSAEAALNSAKTHLEERTARETLLKGVLVVDAVTGELQNPLALKPEFADPNSLTIDAWKSVYSIDITDVYPSGTSPAPTQIDTEVLNKIKAELTTLTQEILAAQAQVTSADTAGKNAAAALTAAKTNLEQKQAALELKKASGDNAVAIQQLTQQQNLMEVNLDAAKTNLEQKKAALTTLTGNINKSLTLQSLYKDVTDAQELVDKEQKKAVGATITADIAGTVTQINAVAGKEVSAAEAVAVIQPEGKGYTLSFTVTNDQARRLSVGDKAEVINSWYYDEMNITLKTIKPDPNNPSQQKLLTFEIQGDVTAGQSLSVSVGQKSADYDLIVPNSAVREDNNGKFVLIVESKSSPLGNRYVATRMDVEVLASDDTQSALKGALYGYEYVITTSTKPVEAGKLVRLAEN